MDQKIEETCELVYSYYERFNENYGNLIDLNKALDAIKSIEVDQNKFPDIVKKRLDCSAMGVQFNNKIYISDDVTPDLLFHEILHFITEEHVGLKIPLAETYDESDLEKICDKYGENIFIRFIDQLNESMTRFITELAIPETEIADSYGYGADFLRVYYNGLISNDIDPEFIFRMYLNGNIDDMIRFKESFGDRFEEVLEAIERINNIRFYVLKKPEDNTMSKEELDQVTLDAVNKIKMNKSK